MKKGDWVRVAREYVGPMANVVNAEHRVGCVRRVSDVWTDGDLGLEDCTYVLRTQDVEPWSPRVGEKVRHNDDEGVLTSVEPASGFEYPYGKRYTWRYDRRPHWMDRSMDLGDSGGLPCLSPVLDPTTGLPVSEPPSGPFRVGDRVEYRSPGATAWTGTVVEPHIVGNFVGIIRDDGVRTDKPGGRWDGSREYVRLLAPAPERVAASGPAAPRCGCGAPLVESFFRRVCERGCEGAATYVRAALPEPLVTGPHPDSRGESYWDVGTLGNCVASPTTSEPDGGRARAIAAWRSKHGAVEAWRRGQ